MVKLIIEDDEGKTTVVPLIRDEISIGRKEGNTIRLTERNISRRHAKLFKQNGAIFIEDLDSYNGIKVNGNPVAGRVAVAEGDRIQIGDYVLGLKLEGASDTLAPPTKKDRTLELPAEEQPEKPTAELPAQTEVTEKISTRDGLRREGSQAKTPAKSPQEEYGRLVCVSSNFPGQEWFLDKSLMVLGRTDDNDIVINHRSISRHHSRISEEAGRYTIKDLQSSNGVRVNGEEYEKVELRRGDLIDLGHVRLRFIAPGEDFVFSRDASIVDISKNGSSHGGLWIALAAAAVVIVGFFLWRMGGEPPKTDQAAAEIQALAQVDSAPAPTVKPPETPPASANLVGEISQAISAEQWSTAIAKCNQLTAEQKQAAQANCEQAAMELAAHEDFEQAHAAYFQHKYLQVLRHLENIPEQSTYKSRDTHILESSRTKYMAQMRASLEQLAERGQCDKAEGLVTEVREVLTESEAEAELAPLLERCEAVKAAAARRIAMAQQAAQNRRRPRPNPGNKPPQQDNNDQPEEPEGNDLEAITKAKEVLQQATNAYVAGNHKRAHTLARQVLKLVPRNTEAIQIIGASSCFLKNAQDAKWAFDRLPAARRNLLKKVCLRNGVAL